MFSLYFKREEKRPLLEKRIKINLFFVCDSKKHIKSKKLIFILGA
jgi:hypothetical protein